MDESRVSACRTKLVATARNRQKITYGALATHLGIANQSLGPYLNSIYKEEMAVGRPDLSLVTVYSKTGFGRFNSGGGPAQSVQVDPANEEDVAMYNNELERAYDEWSS